MKNFGLTERIVITVLVLAFVANFACYAKEKTDIRTEMTAQRESYRQQIRQEQVMLNQLLRAAEERKGNIDRLSGGIITLQELWKKLFGEPMPAEIIPDRQGEEKEDEE